MVDPRFGNVFLDANALDRADTARTKLVDEFQKLVTDLKLSIVKPKRVQDEISNPATPAQVRSDMDGIYTLPVTLNSEEQSKRNKIGDLLRGNAQSTKHEADADHLFEAAKNGGRYFITHDQRILGRKGHIVSILGPEFQIVTLEEFVKICRKL